MDHLVTSVMRAIGEALRLDDNQNYQDAYIKYVECILSIASNLLQYVRIDGGKIVVTKAVERQIQLGGHCMERLSSLLNKFNVQRDSTIMTYDNQTSTRRFSAPVPPLPQQHTINSFSLKRDPTPTEIAFQKNQCIMKAYKARMSKLNHSNPVAASLSLTVQRKIAENLAIAKAQEKALSEKMRETQRRLDEQAARRFTAPIGMSEEELEQRQIYKKILEYEQKVKWLFEWRQKLVNSPKDPVIISQLISQILRCEDHPLSKLLKEYQYKIYEKVYPIVSTKMPLLNEVTVPLPQKLHPKMEEKIDNDRTDNEVISSSDSNANTCISNINDNENLDSHVAESGSSLESIQNCDGINSNLNSNNPTGSDFVISSKLAVNEKDTEHAQTENEDMDKNLCINSDNIDVKDIDDYVSVDHHSSLVISHSENVKDNLEKALEQNEALTKKLTLANMKSDSVGRSVSAEYEKYTDEDMDDLFDDDSDCHQSNMDKTDLNFRKRDADTYVVLSVKDANVNSSLHDQLYKFRTQSEIDFMKSMSEEAYIRHMKGISQDIHGYLDKLLVMFSIAYEELGSAEGQDQCYASIEEPFFKPLWKYLLSLFRLCNRNQEISLAYWMTQQINELPEDYGVSRKLCLSSDADNLPFQSAIDELKKLKDHYTMLSKLECVVCVCRLICDSVENFYVTKQIEDGEISSAPSVGADDLLPILSYVVVKSGLPQLVSECQAMSEYIHEGYIMGEEGYCLTTLQTAINFISASENHPMKK